MSTIIRVKRHYKEEPADTLLLECKRRKIDDEAEETVDGTKLLKLAGTVEDQKTNVFQHIETNKMQLENGCTKQHLASIRDKIRSQMQENSKNSRYKIVNLMRPSLNEDKITIVDIEEEKNEKEIGSKYVYDVYYTSSDDLGEFYEHDYVGVYTVYNQQLVFDTEDPISDPEDSDDSNDENNWRNEYPEEEDDTGDVDQMMTAMKDLNVGEDLSSDDGEEGFVYSIDSEGAGFEEDVDDSDVNRYGERYARFKARFKKDESETEDYFDDEYDNEEGTSYYY